MFFYGMGLLITRSCCCFKHSLLSTLFPIVFVIILVLTIYCFGHKPVSSPVLMSRFFFKNFVLWLGSARKAVTYTRVVDIPLKAAWIETSAKVGSTKIAGI